jgi:hypothetical protein
LPSALHPRLRAAPRYMPFELAEDALIHATVGRLPFADLAYHGARRERPRGRP